MGNRVRRLALLVVAVFIVSGETVRAQLPPEPEAVTDVPRAPLVAPPNRPVLPPPGVVEEGPQGSWFTTIEAGAVGPSLNRLKTSQDGVGTFLGQVHSADLDWTSAGEVGLGYRFVGGNGIGLFIRSFSSSGNRSLTGDAASFEPSFFAGLNDAVDPSLGAISTSAAVREVHTRVDFSRLDLDYLSREHALGDAFHLAWIAGARFATIRVDSEVRDSFTIASEPAPGSGVSGMTLPIVMQQGASARTSAGGVHLGLSGAWAPGKNGWELFGKADGGILLGRSTQSYAVAMSGPLSLPPVEGSVRGPSTVTTLNLQAGIQYTMPLERIWLRFSAGYMFESYWLTATGSGADEHALFKEIDLIDHGPFARCEIRF